ncbi:response regulator transcription factor [Paenibacillus sp. IHBB 3054]|uniref:response regulator transcription factor n=1 Tax=Paenibacillus sp. IHBB 3054 TaxID=3425689 RepID=UPI003F663461
MENVNSNNNILIVDGDRQVRKLLRVYFELEKYNIEEAEQGAEALYKALRTRYIMVILNWQLSDTSGEELCRHFKLIGTAPLIMFIGKADENERIQGFMAGADDFIDRPFSPREVVGRAKAMIGRFTGVVVPQGAQSHEEITISSITIDPRARRVTVKGKEIHFTLKEYELFYFLVKHEGEVFSRENLLLKVWGGDHKRFADHRTVDTHIKRVRHKLSGAFSERNGLIQTVWGYGYMLSFKSM